MKRALAIALLATALSGCAARSVAALQMGAPGPTPISTAAPATAAAPPGPIATDAPARVEYVAVPSPLPLPGQLKPLPKSRPTRVEPSDPRARVAIANGRARIEPSGAGWMNAVQVFPFADGALYQIYAAPGQVTDIALEPGEQLVGSGPVATGDTVRWVIGDTISGSGATARVHILLKPTRPDLQTNLVINTDRRTYHLELQAGERTYMASVSWTYPADALIALRREAAASAAAAPVAVSPVAALEKLDFGYRIEGDHPAWRPLRAFNDGRQVMIEFAPSIGQTELPPIWVLDAKGKAQLVNYRVRGRFMVVDRLFDRAELRLGGKHQERVRIVHDNRRPS